MAPRRTAQSAAEHRRHIDPSERVIAALEEAVKQLTDTVRVLKVAIFGRWDSDENKMIPGVRDDVVEVKNRLAELSEQHLRLQARFDQSARNVRKYGIWVVGPALTFLVLDAAGVPTANVAQLAGDLLRALVHVLAQH